jgi:hypothetical protein
MSPSIGTVVANVKQAPDCPGDGIQLLAIVCHEGHVPEDIEEQYIRADIRLLEVRVPRYPAKRFAELYEAENYPGVIRVLGKTMARALELPE